jgi:hypothetical protein
VEKERELTMGGLRGRVIRKMLTLLRLFEFLDNWPSLVSAGSFQIEVLSGFDPKKREEAERSITLCQHVQQLLEMFYVGDSLSRPYFFRAFLGCRLHGVSRLLPSLGPRAAFNLLWICLHISGVRIINLNLLPNMQNPEQAVSLDKMRSKLESLSLRDLGPERLNFMRQQLLQQGQAYVYDSGIYLQLEEDASVLVPHFLDLEQTTENLGQATEKAVTLSLENLSNRQLFFFQETVTALEKYFNSVPPSPADTDFAACREKLLHYLLGQLFDLPRLAERLQRLISHCPHLLKRLMLNSYPYYFAMPALVACKLNSLLVNKLDLFQDMQSSYQAALAEFGPNATGIIGMASGQFEYIAQRLKLALGSSPQLIPALAGAVLLSGHRIPGQMYGRSDEFLRYENMVGESELSRRGLIFLMRFFKLPYHIITGEAPLNMLTPLLEENSADLLVLVFIFSIIYAASDRGENFLTEDMTDKFINLWNEVEEWRSRDGGAGSFMGRESNRLIHNPDTWQSDLNRYHESAGPGAGKNEFPEEGREGIDAALNEEAKALMARERLFKICGLYVIGAKDVALAINHVPEAFIYRKKGMRSYGLKTFTRELREGLRLHQVLHSHPELERLINRFLNDPLYPLLVTDFASAASGLTPLSQMKLLALTMAYLGPPASSTYSFIQISFQRLTGLNAARISMLEAILRGLTPEEFINPKYGRQETNHFLKIEIDKAQGLITVLFNDLELIRGKAAALKQAADVKELESLYQSARHELMAAVPQHAASFEVSLQAAYKRGMVRLSGIFLDRARGLLSQADNAETLNLYLQELSSQSTGLPLRTRHTLNDLYEINLERLHASLLERTTSQLLAVRTMEELDSLWLKLKARLAQSVLNSYGGNLSLTLAAMFDRRKHELEEQRKSPAGAAVSQSYAG